MKINWTAETIRCVNKIPSLFEEGKSIKDIAKECHVTRYVVWSRLHLVGYEIKEGSNKWIRSVDKKLT